MDNNYDVPVTEAPAETGGKGLSITALVFSIVGLIPCVNLCGVAPIVGLILALVSRAKNAGRLSGMAKAALILSIIGIVLGIIVGIFFGVVGFMGSLAGATGL